MSWESAYLGMLTERPVRAVACPNYQYGLEDLVTRKRPKDSKHPDRKPKTKKRRSED